MTKEDKMMKGWVGVTVINGNSKFYATNHWGRTTVICVTDDRPVQFANECKRAFFYRLRGYKKVKQTDEERKHLLIKENLWGYDGPKGPKIHTYVKQ